MSNDSQEPTITSLLVRALSEEARSLLKKGLTYLDQLEQPSAPPANPVAVVPRTVRVEAVGEPHKTIREAIAETENDIKDIRRETRDRRKWMYLVLTDSPVVDPTEAIDQFSLSAAANTVEKAVEFYGQPAGTVAVESRNHRGQRVVAVWDAVNYGPVPTVEPVFE